MGIIIIVRKGEPASSLPLYSKVPYISPVTMLKLLLLAFSEGMIIALAIGLSVGIVVLLFIIGMVIYLALAFCSCSSSDKTEVYHKCEADSEPKDDKEPQEDKETKEDIF